MSTGLKANNDGSAAIQVGGTDYIQISSTGNVTMPGNLTVTGTITAGAGSPYVIRSYTSPSPWTAPATLKAVKVTVVGGGGAGGPAITVPGNPSPGKGGGGGSGAYAQAYYDAPALSPLTITAGAGTNSFGALVSCTGGASAPAAPATTGSGGSGGSYTPSPATIIAQNGFTGAAGSATTSSTSAGIGFGADTFAGLGFGGTSNPLLTVAGGAGIGYGSGGGGGNRVGTAGTTPGGAGAPGIVIVEEFY